MDTQRTQRTPFVSMPQRAQFYRAMGALTGINIDVASCIASYSANLQDNRDSNTHRAFTDVLVRAAIIAPTKGGENAWGEALIEAFVVIEPEEKLLLSHLPEGNLKATSSLFMALYDILASKAAEGRRP